MANKFKAVQHTCSTPTLFMRPAGSKYHCKGCGAKWEVRVMTRYTILGRKVETRYWLQTKSGRR
jgi:organic radical activating enzyme